MDCSKTERPDRCGRTTDDCRSECGVERSVHAPLGLERTNGKSRPVHIECGGDQRKTISTHRKAKRRNRRSREKGPRKQSNPPVMTTEKPERSDRKASIDKFRRTVGGIICL